MPDTIGRISVPAPVASGQTFSLISNVPTGFSQERPIIIHRFGSVDAKIEQRFQVGFGPRKFQFRRTNLNYADRHTLMDFWEARKGLWSWFTYNVPNADGTTTPTSVFFEKTPLSLKHLTNAVDAGLNFIEYFAPSTAPAPYPINDTRLRYPNQRPDGSIITSDPYLFSTALLSQVQQIIPLIRIRVRESAVPDIFLSDRRVTVGSQLYLPRLLDIGEPGSGVLLSQDIRGSADNVRFTFGNADRVMTLLANDTDLKYAQIDWCLYHINSGILLQLWSGFIRNFVSDGTSQFPVECSDGLYQLTQQYPVRTVSRTCWKWINGPGCPYATCGSGGDPASCSYYFDDPANEAAGTNDDGTWKQPGGCQAHGMADYFGGHPAQPQGVNIKDNSTGTWGFGRNRVTATSIVSESVIGNALAEIWCNDDGDPGKAFMHNAMIIAGRDESDFYDALGIVGAGPIGLYTGMLVYQNSDGYRYIIAPMLDGQTCHGFKVDSQMRITSDTSLGLVQVNGADPQSNSFGLQPDNGPERAAGTAWCEIRRTDTKGIQPTTPDSHSMQVPISQGLAGWVWDASGNRTLVQGLTNPFWIAVNSMLRALGLFNADSTTQLQQFMLPSLIVGDGTGAAEIADDPVTPLVGTDSTEKQFRFQGALAQQKPFRDWLAEILSAGLGYYTWDFGKLRLGSRINASATDAFTLGNMLFQSLRLEPVDATFEHKIYDFADQAYQYQANIADYQDKSHALYYGRAGAPLTSRSHLLGCATLSQALRLAAVVTREEIGGISPAEWKSARNASWRTTILALTTAPGKVASITHPDVPGGYGDFRIQSFRINKDWSVDITGKTVTASMYDLTVGPKPKDVVPDPLPGMIYPIPLGPAWAPFQVQAASNDALFPGEWTFDSDQEYPPKADSTSAAQLIITGRLPSNTFSPVAVTAPSIGTITQSTVGGSIPGGTTLRVSLCANDSNGLPSGPALIAIVQVPAGTNTNSVTLSDIVWPAVPSLTSYTLYVSDDDALICAQQLATGQNYSGTLSAGSGNTYTPNSVSITGPLVRSTFALPSPYVSRVRIKAKPGVHHGIAGVEVTSVTTGHIVSTELIHPTETLNIDGRVVSIIGRPTGSTPFASFTITAHDWTTGDLTVTPDPHGIVQAGDALVIRNKADALNTGTETSITDSGYVNALSKTDANPDGGLVAGAEVGNLIRVIRGTGRGTPPRIITANTTTGLTWDLPLPIDETSIWIIESPTWLYQNDSTSVDNAALNATASLVVAADNYLHQPMVIAGFTVDINGNESPDGDGPIREDWIYGAEGAFLTGPVVPTY